MSLLTGLNHVAILTSDLDRFITFYSGVFGLEVVFKQTTPAFRHAIVRIGKDSWLHPVEVPTSPHGIASSRVFDRGHLDHLALTAASSETFEHLRGRLVECGASDGVVEDLGAFHALSFQDPDGMRGELTLVIDPELEGIHEPRPLGRQPSAAAAAFTGNCQGDTFA
jgi:catechol 2,3-dioxygenase-like lactoylglutathione lyase family enzyme